MTHLADGPSPPSENGAHAARHGRLTALLPAGAVAYVGHLLARDDIVVRLAAPRRTKLGDHRPPGRGVDCHRISVNVDLNPYALLTTLVHELAHAHAWDRQRRRPRRPHGPEWQAAFAGLLRPLLSNAVLPHDVTTALERSLARPRAATCSDRGLLLALSRYDRPDEGRVFAESIAVGAFFRIDDGTVFQAGPMVRTRRQCFECRTGREYRVHGLARVVPLPAAVSGSSSGSPAARPCATRPPLRGRSRRRSS